jgi:Fe-S-cluster-containing hydrogenase component 2
MPTKVDPENCDGCAACKDACPSDAIDMVDGKAVVKDDDCIDCNACVDACTTGAMKPAE